MKSYLLSLVVGGLVVIIQSLVYNCQQKLFQMLPRLLGTAAGYVLFKLLPPSEQDACHTWVSNLSSLYNALKCVGQHNDQTSDWACYYVCVQQLLQTLLALYCTYVYIHLLSFIQFRGRLHPGEVTSLLHG